MKYSQLFGKTQKTAPHDADSPNARLLQQGGFVHQEMAGVYSWLPLGLRTLRKVENIIREEMNALGAQEILMPALQPKEYWVTTGRWDKVDILFKLPSQTGKEYALGASHEEVATPLLQAFISSYKDFPRAFYQIQTKFRDELRAKSGVLRGREFGMKDMYSFHTTQEDFDIFYKKTQQAYLNVFSRCGLQAKMVQASGGIFTENMSHEFQVLTPAGEDQILACPSCSFGQNIEIAKYKEGDMCPQCGEKLMIATGIEVGNIFEYGSRYTKPFGLTYTTEKGEKQLLNFMGAYGIGTTRLVGTIVEALYDDRGMSWPKSVAPFQVHLISIRNKKGDGGAAVESTCEALYDALTHEEGIEVLYDERDISPGEKFADADLIGIPLRIVISERTLKENAVEWKLRTDKDAQLVPQGDVHDKILAYLKE